MKSRIAKLLITTSIAGLLLGATSALAQWAVFDAHNYAQNVLEAARALQQINNQIREGDRPGGSAMPNLKEEGN